MHRGRAARPDAAAAVERGTFERGLLMLGCGEASIRMSRRSCSARTRPVASSSSKRSSPRTRSAPGPEGRRVSLALDSVTFDCADVMGVAPSRRRSVGPRPRVGCGGARRPGSVRTLRQPYFQPVPEEGGQEPCALDLRASGSMAAEVERLEGSARRSSGRVDEEGSFWTVMLDPEGNELCVLRGPEDGWPGYAEA